jgi:hypothetical protein
MRPPKPGWLFALLVTLSPCHLVTLSSAQAPVPPNNPWCPSACCSWKSRRAWCPNDYCPKSLPAPPPAPPFVFPNDYCKKTLPSPPPVPPCCLPNDYCKKPCPIRIGPCVEPWYTCGVRPSK